MRRTTDTGTRRGILGRAIAGAVAGALLLGGTGCGANPPEVEGFLGGSTGTSAADLKQRVDPSLRARLPAEVRKRGYLVSANNGSFPPYEIAGSDGHTLRGATADMSTALEDLLGVEIKHVTVDGLPGLLTGIKAGRYDIALGPTGDFPERQEQNDFIDWVREFVVFGVRKGNPKNIGSIGTTCGLKISVMAGGSAEDVIRGQADKCRAQGDTKLEVQSYKDQPSAVLAVQAGRADGFFSSQAPLSYFVEMAKKDLELAGVGEKNGFTDLYQGAIVPKNGAMRDVLLDAINELIRNGTYGKIMAEWKVQENQLDEAGINLAR